MVLYTLSQGIRTSESLLPRMWHFVSGFGLGVMRFWPQCSLSSLAARSRHQVFVAHGRLHRLLSRSSGSRTGWNAWRAVRRLLAAKFRVSSNWSDSNPEPIGSPDLLTPHLEPKQKWRSTSSRREEEQSTQLSFAWEACGSRKTMARLGV